jgi:hypothetical protein
VIFVEAGRARTQERGGKVRELDKGSTFYTAPGVAHWHGATPAAGGMTQVAMSFGATRWMERVSDSDYGRYDFTSVVHRARSRDKQGGAFLTQERLMLISIVNHTSGKLTDALVQDAVRAINAQMVHDFKPYWHIHAELRLEGSIGKDPDDEALPELRGDAIIYLWDDVNADDALGFHESSASGVPFGFVFTELSKELGESWTVTLSHEALELIGDPEANLLVVGPHPADPKKEVFHWYEMCDAVQDETTKSEEWRSPIFCCRCISRATLKSAVATISLARERTAATDVVRDCQGRLHRLLQSRDARARDARAERRPASKRAGEDQEQGDDDAALEAVSARHDVPRTGRADHAARIARGVTSRGDARDALASAAACRQPAQAGGGGEDRFAVAPERLIKLPTPNPLTLIQLPTLLCLGSRALVERQTLGVDACSDLMGYHDPHDHQTVSRDEVG